jgi:heat shock protein HslJ
MATGETCQWGWKVTGLLLILVGCAQPPLDPEGGGLEGTSWQLVQFEGGDDRILRPDDRSKYTLTFNRDHTFGARVDCNRGGGAWKSTGKDQLELSAMAVTRAMCPAGSLDREIVKRLPHVRSYLIKDGRLFMSMEADGGTFEFEPLR